MVDVELRVTSPDLRPNRAVPSWIYYPLFFISGFPALLYQIVWQRALFAIYGINIESVTVIVSVFMLGLGLGSILGGKVSNLPGLPLLRTFGIIEVSIGVFGAVSLPVFHEAARFTAGASVPATGAITFALLLIPTLLMGSTLPLFSAYLVRYVGNVGETVATLYCVNTLGSAAACIAAAYFLMRALGESGTLRAAAVLNAVVGATALCMHRWSGPEDRCAGGSKEFPAGDSHPTIPLATAMFLASASGFIALAYEILWFRLFSFTAGGSAPSFAKLLGFYLAGIAYGSFAVRDICHRLAKDLPRIMQVAGATVMYGSIAGFLVGPAVALSVRYVDYDVTYVFVFVGAALMGAAFPILSHAAIDPRRKVGSRVSYLYVSNIIGSALGSFLAGFVVFDHWSTRVTCVGLLLLGLIVTAVMTTCARALPLKPSLVAGAIVCAGLLLFSGPIFSGLYERLLFKTDYVPGMRFSNLVENGSGVVAVGSDETVYGGGVYDGRFSVDLVKDVNGIFRAYAIAALHPRPESVLIIGLSSGSWAQVVANLPAVKDVTIIEINPGYLPLIRQRSSVASLLQNPKVRINIDDGRRWLMRNPERKFDFVLMNTSFHWRAHTSSLLSAEFLRLVRRHLNPGGIHYYNTTGSGEVQATGVAEYPFAQRVGNFLAVSDSPITFDRNRLRSVLASYRIDGRRILDLSDEKVRERVEEVVGMPEVVNRQSGLREIESRASLLDRLKGARLITDDNMGTEWQ